MRYLCMVMRSMAMDLLVWRTRFAQQHRGRSKALQGYCSHQQPKEQHAQTQHARILRGLPVSWPMSTLPVNQPFHKS